MPQASPPTPPLRRARSKLAARLKQRRKEIEEAALTRIHAIADPTGAGDFSYQEGLRAALAAGLDYGIEGIERGAERQPPPPALLAQARLAAQCGISLDTVLRRYFAVYSLLSDFLIEEAERDGLLSGADLKRLTRGQAVLFDRLLAVVSEEHEREAEERPQTTAELRAETVRGLLAGELLDASELAYDLEACHLGMIATGPGAERAIESIAGQLDCRLLALDRGEGLLWAWIGARRAPDPDALRSTIAPELGPGACLAIGEPAEGLQGWRLTHRQAKAALAVAMRSQEGFARYGEVALLATILGDELLEASLRRLFLEPLQAERDGGEAARETLRAYFAAGRNASSAAAALGVNRNTVAARLRAVEERLGRRLGACMAELEAALWLEGLGIPSTPESLHLRDRV